MGFFDKLKKLSSNLNSEKVQSMINSVNVENISKNINSSADSMGDKIESVNAEDMTTKITSAADRMHEKEPSKAVKDEYEDEELKARKKERNKKIAKGVAKGAMFVGGFLYAQREGADKTSSLIHAFNKTKTVDEYFDGKKKEDDEPKENKSSKDKKIITIGHYEYICAESHRTDLKKRVPNIDILTVNSMGAASTEEAVEVIAKVMGIDKSLAYGIWNGGNSVEWHRTSFTYVNDGELGGTVKCR